MKLRGLLDPTDPLLPIPAKGVQGAECDSGPSGCPVPQAGWYLPSAVRRGGEVMAHAREASAWRLMHELRLVWPHGDPHCGADRYGFNLTHRAALKPISGKESTGEGRRAALDAWAWMAWC